MFVVLPPFFALLFKVLLLLLFLPLDAWIIASWCVRVFSEYSGKISVASFLNTFHPFTAVQHPWSSRSAELQTRRDTCMAAGRRQKSGRTEKKDRGKEMPAWTSWSVPPSVRDAHTVFKLRQVFVKADN